MNVLGSKRQLQEERVALPREDHAKEPPLFTGGEFAQFFGEVQESIARRAYELFDARGGEDGQDLADWLRAEAEMAHPLNEKISESNDAITVRATISGFSADDLKIGAETRRIIINGKREETSQSDGGTGLQASLRLLSIIDLPADVVPDKAKASLQGKNLTISLPKANAEEGSQISK